MEPEGSLPHSQVPATWASSIQSTPQHTTSWRSVLILSSTYAWVSQVVSFPQVSPPKPCIRLFSPQYALHAPPIPFFSILSAEQYTTRFNFQKSYIVLTLRLCVLYRSRSRQRLSYKTLADWFRLTEVESVYCTVRTEAVYVPPTRLVFKGFS